ncbi:MAG TPA: TonB family protein [Burkholderiales bacterium]|nr:TonB family protein [Burkholderiales bacterium]
MNKKPMYGLQAPRTRAPGLLLAAGMHAAVIAAVWNYQPTNAYQETSAPIMVSLITAPQVAQPVVTPPEPPKPRPVTKPQPPKKTLLSTPTPAPAAFETAPPPEPTPPVQVATTAPVKEEPAPPVQLPIFNADYLRNPAPVYPPLSRRLHEQGKVMLRVFVGLHGQPEKIELDRSSGSERLDRSALEAVKQWKFVPARQGDTPVAAWVRVPISFSLES